MLKDLTDAEKKQLGEMIFLRHEVLEILKAEDVVEKDFKDLDFDLLESSSIDSLSIVELANQFEEKFNITLEPSDLRRFSWSSPKAMIKMIDCKIKGIENKVPE